MVFFYVRIGMYTAVTLAAFQGLIIATVSSPVPGAFFKEGGPWEWMEFSFVAASGAILLLNAQVSGRYRTILQVFGLLALCAAVRELDYLFEQLVFDGAYKLINWSILAFCGYLVWKHRWHFTEELAGFSRTAPFYFIFVGCLIVVVYAQLMGQQDLWKAIMGDSYSRIVKRSVEEILETLGYTLILVGAVETLFLPSGYVSTAWSRKSGVLTPRSQGQTSYGSRLSALSRYRLRIRP